MQSSGCPHLGTFTDPETRFTFADEGNVCYARSKPQDIDLAHQTHYCLTHAYLTCPVYQLRQKSLAKTPVRANAVLMPRGVAILAIAVLLFVFWGIAFLVRFNLLQVSNANGEGTSLPVLLPSAKVTSIATIYIFGQASATSLPTVTMPPKPSATPFLPEPTATPITPSPTPLPPTFTPTPSETPLPSATFTPIFVPSATRPPQLPSATVTSSVDTRTTVPPTATDTPLPAPTDTPLPVPTDTPLPAPTDTPQPTATVDRPPVASPTPTSDRPTVQP